MWAKRSSSSSCFFYAFEALRKPKNIVHIFRLTHLANDRKTRFSPRHGILQNNALTPKIIPRRVVMACSYGRTKMSEHQFGISWNIMMPSVPKFPHLNNLLLPSNAQSSKMDGFGQHEEVHWSE